MFHDGLPGTTATALAYEQTRRIFAVGTNNGFVVLYRHSQCAPLYLPQLPTLCPVTHIVLLPAVSSTDVDAPLCLLVADRTNSTTVYHVNASTLSILPVFFHTFSAGITACCHLPGLDGWIAVGLGNGRIVFVDTLKGCLAEYNIMSPSPSSISNSNSGSGGGMRASSLPVVAVQSHPLDSNKLLCGYASGYVMIWSIRAKKARIVFKLPDAPAQQSSNIDEADTSLEELPPVPNQVKLGRLVALTFNPTGSHVAAAFASGSVVVWDVEFPDFAAYEHPSPFDSIRQLLWCSSTSAGIADSVNESSGDDSDYDQMTRLLVAERGHIHEIGLTRHMTATHQRVIFALSDTSAKVANGDSIVKFVALPPSTPWYLGTRDISTGLVHLASGAIITINASIPPELAKAARNDTRAAMPLARQASLTAKSFASKLTSLMGNLSTSPTASPAPDLPSRTSVSSLASASDNGNTVPVPDSLELTSSPILYTCPLGGMAVCTVHTDASVRLWNASTILQHLHLNTVLQNGSNDTTVASVASSLNMVNNTTGRIIAIALASGHIVIVNANSGNSVTNASDTPKWTLTSTAEPQPVHFEFQKVNEAGTADDTLRVASVLAPIPSTNNRVLTMSVGSSSQLPLIAIVTEYANTPVSNPVAKNGDGDKDDDDKDGDDKEDDDNDDDAFMSVKSLLTVVDFRNQQVILSRAFDYEIVSMDWQLVEESIQQLTVSSSIGYATTFSFGSKPQNVLEVRLTRSIAMPLETGLGGRYVLAHQLLAAPDQTYIGATAGGSIILSTFVDKTRSGKMSSLKKKLASGNKSSSPSQPQLLNPTSTKRFSISQLLATSTISSNTFIITAQMYSPTELVAVFSDGYCVTMSIDPVELDSAIASSGSLCSNLSSAREFTSASIRYDTNNIYIAIRATSGSETVVSKVSRNQVNSAHIDESKMSLTFDLQPECELTPPPRQMVKNWLGQLIPTTSPDEALNILRSSVAQHQTHAPPPQSPPHSHSPSLSVITSPPTTATTTTTATTMTSTTTSPPMPSSVESAASPSQPPNLAAHAAQQALMERDERLSELSSTTANLSASSSRFLEEIKQLTEAQKNRKWYQL